MKSRMKISVDLSQEILEAIDKPFEERFYENECLADYKKRPYELFIFVRTFGTKRNRNGKITFYSKREVESITGKTKRELGNKLEKLIDGCWDQVPTEAGRDWLPEKWIFVKKALKIFQLLKGNSKAN